MAEEHVDLGKPRDRLVVDLSVDSYLLVERALRAYIGEIAERAAGLQALGDDESFKAAQKDYFHGQNLLAKFRDGRSLRDYPSA